MNTDAPSEHLPASATTHPTHRRTILLVEDSPTFRAIYQRYLRQHAPDAYHYLEATTGEQGLHICHTTRIDCIILDYLLPDMDGLAFLNALNRTTGAASSNVLPCIPVVMITGEGSEAIAVQVIQRGAMNYLVKDHVSPDSLRQAVEHAIERHTLLRQVEQQQAALMQSAARFRTSLDTMLDCFGIYTAIRDEDGHINDFCIEYVNQAACAHHNLAYHQQVGQRLCTLFPAFCPPGLFAAFCHVVATGQPLSQDSLIYANLADEHQPSHIYDMRAVKLDDGLALAWRDITERKRTEAERDRLLHDEQIARRIAERAVERTTRLQTVTAALSAGISFTEVAQVIVDQSLAALEGRAGFVALLTPDSTCLDIVGADGYAPEVLHAWHNLSTSVPTPISIAMQTGQPIWVESRAVCMRRYPVVSQIDTTNHAWVALPLLVDEQAVGGLSLSFATARTFSPEDQAYMLTLAQQCAQALARARLYAAEQQARAEAEAAVQLRDQVFGTISHDLKNPLTVIHGYVAMLRRSIAPLAIPERDQLLRKLHRIEAAVSQIFTQVHELLDVVRLRAGQPLPLTHQPLDLVALATHIANVSQSLTEQHTIRVETTLPALPILGDASRLERVISNLLTNAIRYSPGGGEIILRLAQDDNPTHPCATLTVQDQGMGIPAADLPSIFEPFKRGSNIANYIPGTGLGLASVRQIIEQHDGTITVTSTEGKGTTFTVALPLHISVLESSP